jgi:hypothetical protein
MRRWKSICQSRSWAWRKPSANQPSPECGRDVGHAAIAPDGRGGLQAGQGSVPSIGAGPCAGNSRRRERQRDQQQRQDGEQLVTIDGTDQWWTFGT